MPELNFNNEELEYNQDSSNQVEQGQQPVDMAEDYAFNKASQPLRNKAQEYGQKAYDGLKSQFQNNYTTGTTGASSEVTGLNESGGVVTSDGVSTATAQTSTEASATATESVGSTIACALSEGVSVLAVVLAIVILLVLIIVATLPPSLRATTDIFDKTYEDIFHTVELAIEDEYLKLKKESQPELLTYINSKYKCKATAQDLVWHDEDNLSVKTKTCAIDIEFEPPVDIMAKAISAYLVSVDGTILYFTDNYKDIDKNLIIEHGNKITGYDTRGLPEIKLENYVVQDGTYQQEELENLPKYKMSPVLKNYLRENYSDINYNATSHEFLDTVKHYSSTYFDLKKQSEWEDGVKEHRFEESEEVCYKRVGADKVETDKEKCNLDVPKYFKGEKITYTDGFKGKITIPIEYDLKQYRKHEMDALVEKLVARNQVCAFWDNEKIFNNEKCTEDEAKIYINVVFSNYYLNSIQELDIMEYLIYGNDLGLMVNGEDLDPALIKLTVNGWLTSPFGDKTFKVTARFGASGCRDYLCGKTHHGTDFGCPEGTDIYSVSSGTIISRGYAADMGNYYTIQTDDGYTIRYMHLSAHSTKGVGDKVDVGSFLGLSGNTGMSTGAHLHIDVKDSQGQWKDYCSYAGC